MKKSSGAPTATADAEIALTDEGVDPASRLLAKAPLLRGESLLFLECGLGVSSLRFENGFSEIVCQNSFYQNFKATAAQLLDSQFLFNRYQNHLDDLPQAGKTKWAQREGGWKQIRWRLRKGTAIWRAVLEQSTDLLAAEGELYVAGLNDEGIQSVAKGAALLFDRVDLALCKWHGRLLRISRPKMKRTVTPLHSGYFDTKRLECIWPSGGEPLTYLTRAGLFSSEHTDPGSELLIKHLPQLTGKRVLDFGCGSGLLSLAAHRLGCEDLTAVDHQINAVSITQTNLEKAQARGHSVCTASFENVPSDYDVILSHPPFHAGGKTDYQLPERFVEAFAKHLKPLGEVYLVANRFLPYDRLGQAFFHESEVLEANKSYHVVALKRPKIP